jgi:hypothetical protein
MQQDQQQLNLTPATTENQLNIKAS